MALYQIWRYIKFGTKTNLALYKQHLVRLPNSQNNLNILIFFYLREQEIVITVFIKRYLLILHLGYL